MKDHLPKGHGLSEAILNSQLVHKVDGKPQLTDAQFEGISANIAKGESILLVAPTSSGKTEVGLIGIAAWLTGAEAMTRRAVYLVSHRALARQKFKQLNSTEYLSVLGIDRADVAMSNGDLSIDGEGNTPEEPLDVRFLIATYEKFLALLAGSGLRKDMSHYCVVADEFQIIADRGRGQEIEILFTMIREASFGQFIGLSATLEANDLKILSEWMSAKPIVVSTREVPLTYELRLPNETYIWRTDKAQTPTKIQAAEFRSVIAVLAELEKDAKRNFPVAVFCMTKPQVESLAREWGTLRGVDGGEKRLQPDMFDEPTALSEALAIYMPNGFGIHTADLIEGERALVEQALDGDDLAVVFATTTLAQGLNYSFKTVIFCDWTRYNFDRRQAEPISRGEFHNIAGRAGRLGKTQDQHGRVIYFAEKRAEQIAAAKYLSSQMDQLITGKIDPERVDQVSLQLLSSGIVDSEDALVRFFERSLSGYLLAKSEREPTQVWRQRVSTAVRALEGWGFVTRSGDLDVTELGSAVAYSSLLPRTAAFYLEFFRETWRILPELLEAETAPGTDREVDRETIDHLDIDLAFVLFHLIYCSPEFGDAENEARRFLPYPLAERRESARATRLERFLAVRPWDANAMAVNAADISADWIGGGPLSELEERFGRLRAGMIYDMHRTLASHLAGVAEILTAATQTARQDLKINNLAWIELDARKTVFRLIRRLRQFSLQATRGLPDDVMWMSDVVASDNRPLIGRNLAMQLRTRGLATIEDILDKGKTNIFSEAIKAVGANPILIERIRQGAQQVRIQRTESHISRIRKRLGDCGGLVVRYFSAREKEFEERLSECFQCLKIAVVDRDGADRKKVRFPDFVLTVNGGTVVLECKSSVNGDGVNLTGATDVGGKALAHGLQKHAMVTVCQAYVSTDVPRLIEGSTNLSVVNAEDLAVAMSLLKSEKIDEAKFGTWLTTPGQPKAEELFRS